MFAFAVVIGTLTALVFLVLTFGSMLLSSPPVPLHEDYLEQITNLLNSLMTRLRWRNVIATPVTCILLEMFFGHFGFGMACGWILGVAIFGVIDYYGWFVSLLAMRLAGPVR
jgi:hypothetical protein